MADVTISSTVQAAQYATTFESVDTDARIIVQDGKVIIASGGKLYLAEGWLLVCDSLVIVNAVSHTPLAASAADSEFDLIIRDSEVRVNGGDDNNANQVQGGRVRIVNGILRNMSTESTGQYMLGSFQPADNTYYDIDGLRISGQTQRLLIQFFRAESSSIIKGMIFEGGHTDLNFNAGSEATGIETNQLNADSDIGIESRDLDSAAAAYDSSATDPVLHDNSTETLSTPYRNGETGFKVYTYFDQWKFGDKTSGGDLAAFPLLPRPGYVVILIDPTIEDDRPVAYNLLNSVSDTQSAMTNGATTWVEFRYRFKPKFVFGATTVAGVKVRIDHAGDDYATFHEKGRKKHTSGVFYIQYTESGNTNPSRWSFTAAQMVGKFYGDHTPATSNQFITESAGTFAEAALIRTRFAEATSTAAADTTLTKFTGNFGLRARHYAYNEIAETNRDFEDLAAATPTYNLVLDENVTATKTITDAYTELITWDQLYDRIKSDRSDYETDMPLPTRTGTGALDLGATSIVFDPSATAVLAYDSSTTTLTVKSGGTFSNGSRFTSAATTGTISVKSGETVVLSASYLDSSGVQITIRTPGVPSANVLYRIVPDSGTTTTVYTTTDSDGVLRVSGVAAASHVYVIAKKDAYSWARTDFDPSITTEASLVLMQEPAIDPSVSLTTDGTATGTALTFAAPTYADTSSKTAAERANHIYPVYTAAVADDPDTTADETANAKLEVVFGGIDLDPRSNPRKLSNRVMDHILGLQAALEFLLQWNTDGSQTAQGGIFYRINTDRQMFALDYFDLVRIPDMTSTEESHYGQYVEGLDGSRYRPPHSEEGLVDVAGEANVVETPAGVLQEAAVRARQDMDDNSTKLADIISDTAALEARLTAARAGEIDEIEYIRGRVKHISGIIDKLPPDFVLYGTKVVGAPSFSRSDVVLNPNVLPSTAVQSATVSNNVLTLVFRDKVPSSLERIIIENQNIPFTLSGLERLRMEVTLEVENVNTSSTRTEAAPIITAELTNTPAGSTAVTIGQIQHVGSPEIEIGKSGATVLVFDFGRVTSSTINEIEMLIQVASTDADRLRVILSNIRFTVDDVRSLDDFKADVQPILDRLIASIEFSSDYETMYWKKGTTTLETFTRNSDSGLPSTPKTWGAGRTKS